MNSRSFRQILLTVLMVIPGFSGITVYATAISVVDTTHVQQRIADSKLLENYRHQKEFKYSTPPLQPNFLSRLFDYLKKRLGFLKKYSSYMPVMFKILAVIIFIFFLFLAIYKTKVYKLFYAEKALESDDFAFIEHVKDEIDFDQEIQSQLYNKQFRLVIRLLYLKTINQLRIRGYIHYSKEKTNVDYFRDLTSHDLKSGFYAITSIYNHVWYGDVEIEEDQFLSFEKSFQSFYSAINVQE